MKAVSLVAVAVAGVCLIAATVRGEIISRGSGCAERRISLADYRDRMRGAWIGQIVDFGRVVGPMKPLHGVNNAPMRVADGSRQDEFVLLTTVGLTSVK